MIPELLPAFVWVFQGIFGAGKAAQRSGMGMGRGGSAVSPKRHQRGQPEPGPAGKPGIVPIPGIPGVWRKRDNPKMSPNVIGGAWDTSGFGDTPGQVGGVPNVPWGEGTAGAAPGRSRNLGTRLGMSPVSPGLSLAPLPLSPHTLGDIGDMPGHGDKARPQLRDVPDVPKGERGQWEQCRGQARIWGRGLGMSPMSPEPRGDSWGWLWALLQAQLEFPGHWGGSKRSPQLPHASGAVPACPRVSPQLSHPQPAFPAIPGLENLGSAPLFPKNLLGIKSRPTPRSWSSHGIWDPSNPKPNPKSNPKSQTHPKSRIPSQNPVWDPGDPKSQNSKPKTQSPKPKFQNPNPSLGSQRSQRPS